MQLPLQPTGQLSEQQGRQLSPQLPQPHRRQSRRRRRRRFLPSCSRLNKAFVEGNPQKVKLQQQNSKCLNLQNNFFRLTFSDETKH